MGDIIVLDLNKPWPKDNGRFSMPMDDPFDRQRKSAKQFITVLE